MMKSVYQFNYRFFIALLSNNIGNSLFSFALPLFILKITNSPIHLSIVTALNTIPYLIASLPFGYFIDHFNKLKTIMICDICNFFIYLFLAITLKMNLSTSYIIFAIYFVTFINGMSNVARGISETSIIPELFEERHFAKANSFVFSTQYLCSTIMPAIGGVIYTLVDLSVFALVNAITFLLCAVIMFSMKSNHQPTIQINDNKKLSYNLKDGILSGLKVVCRKKNLLLPLVFAACTNLLTANFSNDYIYLLKNVLQYNSKVIGIVQSVIAVAALGGSFAISQLYKKFSFQQLFFNSLLLISLTMIALSIYPSIYIIIICLAINYFVRSCSNILVITNRQFSTPKEYLARADGVYKMILLGASSFGAILGGILTSYLGVSLAIIISGSLVLIASILYIVCDKKIKDNQLIA